MNREQLEAAIVAQEELRGSVPDEVVDVAIAALRRQAESVSDTQRRRLATVLFGDLRGFTAMSETLDAEELSEVMNAVWARLDAAITEHGGHIDKHMGDGLMAIWGVSATREDDPERAVRAGLSLQSALSEFREERGIPLTMRVGVSSGQVVLGAVGTTSEFTALGDAVNLASRLEHEAPTHGVLLSHETYRHVRGVFEAVARPPMAIRGKATLVRTYLVSAVKPRAFRSPSRGVEGVETTMVGRDRELDALERAYFDAVEHGTSVWVTVSGDAGAGKSRLLWEFENWLELRPEPIFFLTARATTSRQSVPLGLLRDLIANRMDIADTDPPDVVRTRLVRGTQDALDSGDAMTLGRWLGFDLGQRAVAGPEGEALASLGRAHMEGYIKGLARRGPTVVLLEDLHWADDLSLETLSRIQQHLADESMVVVSSSRLKRPSTLRDVRPGSLVQVDLEALDDDDIEALLREILARAEGLPTEFVRTLTERAEGNAFYLEELVKMLIDRGSIDTGAEVWTISAQAAELVDVPPTLTGVLQARFDALPEDARRSLALGAVVGRTFWDRAIEFLSRPASPTLTLALERELIFSQPTSRFNGSAEYVFKHALLYDVVRETVLLKDRPHLHQRAADWLEQESGERRDEFLVEIGEHLRLGGEHERAATTFVLAAEFALSAGNPSSSAHLGRRALEQYGKTDQPVPTELLISLSHAYRAVGDLEEAKRAATRAVASARVHRDATELARALDAAVQVLGLLGDVAGREALLDEAIEVAQGVGGDTLARVLIQRAVADLRAGRDATVVGQRLLELAEFSDNDQLITRAHIVASRIADSDRDDVLSEHHLSVALDIARRSGDRWTEVVVLNNTGASLQQRGTDDGSPDVLLRADAVFRQAIALCADLHLGEMFATNTMNLAEVRLGLDDPRQACVFLRTALGEASRIGSVPLLLFGVIVYAQVLIHQGDTERACHLVSVLEHHPSRELVEDELERLRQRLPDIPSSRSVPTGNETDVSSFEDIVRGIIAGTVCAV